MPTYTREHRIIKLASRENEAYALPNLVRGFPNTYHILLFIFLLLIFSVRLSSSSIALINPP